jgi:hypothetical protein
LVSKGIISSDEAATLTQGTPAEQQSRLIDLLRSKGVLSSAEADNLATPPAASQVSGALVASTAPMVPSTMATIPAPQAATKPEAPKVIPAVTPLRVLQLEPSPPSGMIPDIKLGTGAKLKIYGLVKASSIYDSSAPYGTDMPLPGFINTSISTGTNPFDPGPTGGSEFHTKARFARVGASFDWPDVSPKTAVTGKFEFDFEATTPGR